MHTTSAVVNLDVLPRPGTDDLSLPLRQSYNLWLENLRLVDMIRVGPVDLPQGVRQRVDNCRFHIASGVALIERHLRTSGTPFEDQLVDIPGIRPTIANLYQELRRAKASWNAWLEGQDLGFGLGGFGADAGWTVVETVEVTAQNRTQDSGGTFYIYQSACPDLYAATTQAAGGDPNARMLPVGWKVQYVQDGAGNYDEWYIAPSGAKWSRQQCGGAGGGTTDIVPLLVLAGVGLAAWYVWRKR